MSIWYQKPDVKTFERYIPNTMIEHLDIRVEEVGDDFLMGSMPVDHRTVQSFGICHGGAYVVLAETLGSFASLFCVDFTQYHAVGLDINSNHIRAVKEGRVIGKASPIHLGRSTQVWEIRITNEAGKLANISRLTCVVKKGGVSQELLP